MNEHLETVIGAIICISTFILLIIPLAVLYSYKGIVTLIAKLINPSLIPLKPIDAILTPGSSSPSAGQNCGVTFQLDGIVELQNVKKLFKESFLSNPSYFRYRQYPITFLGYPFYKEDSDFNINNHINEIVLESGEILEDIVSEYFHRRYPKNRPRWGIILIQNRSTRKSAITYKMHHGCADGCSLLKVMDKLTGSDSPYFNEPDKTSFWDNLRKIFRASTHFKKLAWNLKDDILGHLKNVPRDPYRMRFAYLNLDTMKAIRKRHNVQFITLIITILTSALIKHFRKTNILKNNSTASQMGVAFSLPLPGHPALDPNPATGKLCNHMTAARYGVPAAGDLTSLQRLLQIDATSKEYQELRLHKLFNIIHSGIIPCLPEKLLTKLTDSKSNVPLVLATMVGGNYDNINVLGNRVEDIHFTVSHADQALYLLTMTYANRYSITFLSIHKLFTVEEMDHFVKEALPKELDELNEQSKQWVNENIVK